MFKSYALYWADFFGLNGRTRGRAREIVRTEGLEHLKDALRNGKGALLVTAHLGNWDMGGAALVETGEFPDFSAIVEPVTKKASERTVTDMRERRGIKVIPLGKPMGIARALRRNEVVLVVGERLIDGDGVEVEFFGEKTMFPRGAAYWSARLGTPIVPAFCIRQPDGTYVSYIEAPLMPPAEVGGKFDVAGHTQRLASIIESYITRYPEQWCMLQPIWGSAGGRR
jgi:KDO2-lipid IV(A) lauroyltransferase